MPPLVRNLMLVAGMAFFIAEARAVKAAPLVKTPPSEPAPEKVRESLDKGVKYLKSQMKDQGGGTWSWENDSLTMFLPAGTSALAVLALLDSGLKPDDETVVRGLAYLRKAETKHTYTISLQTQVFCKANQKDDADRIRRNVKWLEEAAVGTGNGFEGWTYVSNSNNPPDHSNACYAVAALHAAHKAGFKAKREGLWEDIRTHFVRTQRSDGGWGYGSQVQKGVEKPDSALSMTTVGLLCLSHASTSRRNPSSIKGAGCPVSCGHFPRVGPTIRFGVDSVVVIDECQCLFPQVVR